MSTSSRIFSLAKYLLLFAIGLLLLWLTFRNENPREIFDKIKQANFFYVTVSVFIGFLAFIIRAHRWNMMLEPLGYFPKLINTSYALGIGYFANLAIPRIGEITRCGTLSKAEKIPFEKLIGTVIIERIIDVIMLAFVMMLVAILEFDLLKNFIIEKIIQPMNSSANSQKDNHSLTLFIVIGILLFILFLIFVFKSKNAKAIREKIISIWNGTIDGLKSIFRMKKTSAYIFYTFLMWFFYFLATYVCFFAFTPTAQLTAKEGMFILVAGGLGMSAPVQGGIGAYHYIVSQALMLFGISLTDGIVFATIVHSFQTFLVILLGCISLVMVFRGKKNKL
ncbi:MAG: lysylphosphatidylglycerol synthase transmembrane domain-containing protein [Bacteroidia bacterium]